MNPQLRSFLETVILSIVLLQINTFIICLFTSDVAYVYILVNFVTGWQCGGFHAVRLVKLRVRRKLAND